MAITSQALAGIRAAAEQSNFYFQRVVLGMKFYTQTLHREMCDFMQTALLPDEATEAAKKLMLVFRDSGKTTVMKGTILHHLIQPEENNCYFPGMAGSETRMIIGGETSKNAARHLRNIETVIEKNQLFQALWPHIKPGRKWSEHEMELVRATNYSEPTVEALGVDTAIASRHVDHIFADDIVTFAASQSPTLMESANLWYKALDAILDETENKQSRLTLTGTPWSTGDVYKGIIDNNDLSTAEGIPPEFAFYIRPAIENQQSIWPERFSLDRFKRIEFNLRGTGRWELNYMCQYTDGANNDLKISWLQPFTYRNGVIYVA